MTPCPDQTPPAACSRALSATCGDYGRAILLDLTINFSYYTFVRILMILDGSAVGILNITARSHPPRFLISDLPPTCKLQHPAAHSLLKTKP